ncbi:two-component system, chemotaxis family, sensor kinase CheA [Methylobacterium sp. 174MFSha1.1]|uniref:hybrid sensor histidine kinase/response regulator n=1 Tax=Methylobacterium sp. 174MFSha1.1 TaxID=1502749 RepID=UPI0008F1D25B|nr:response regulator [Methylobacterium sp. 174MFSha1.1]SFV04804.1 two-component system, chemotaxis family, sensor kinase CheA [Methylobacterium sp. 174MFSha1.1]
MDDIRQLLLAAFDAEHREHLAAIRAALAEAEAGRPADWNDVFRRAHSLKGAARAVDLPAVEEVAHRLEALFDRVVQGRTGLDRRTAGVVDLALDRIEGLVAGLAETPEPAAPADAIAALDACLSGAPIPDAKPDITPEIRPESGPAPAPERLPDPAPPAHQDHAVAYLRIASDQVESLSKAVHDLTAVLQGQEAIGGAVAGLESGARGLRRSVDSVQGRTGEMVALARRLREAGDPAGIALDGFVDRVRRLDGDLRAVIRGISGLARVQSRSTGAIDGALRRLRDDADRLLLVPAETVFGGYGRMVREIAREAGLAVEVRLHGLDLQVDRGLLQALKDPVLHALRNTISHGAESPEVRREAGKPEALSVTLSVASKGSQLVVTIRDDGRGPDLARILETGRRQGLVSPGSEPGRDEILDLVFAPGFSTAAAIDRIAGRGMGLSVVAEAARSLRGRATLRPAEPHGTEVTITVPLSAARQPVLLVEAALRPGEAPQTFGLPSGAIAGLLRLSERDLASVAGEPAARIKQGGRDVVVPLVPLASLLGSGVAPLPLRDGLVRAVLLRCGPASCAVAVDRLLDVRVLLVGPAPPFGGDPALMSGTVMLADETPALVLDPEGLCVRARTGGLVAAPVATPERRATRVPTVLVVDDSITTRTLEKSILEAHGYRVFVCVDGQDALDRLRRDGADVDLVVADVEMPRLDGFGLLQAVKADPGLTRLPVILMTSRGDPADIRRGLDLGADAYITKQKFDQRELLDTIGQLL